MIEPLLIDYLKNGKKSFGVHIPERQQTLLMVDDGGDKPRVLLINNLNDYQHVIWKPTLLEALVVTGLAILAGRMLAQPKTEIAPSSEVEELELIDDVFQKIPKNA